MTDRETGKKSIDGLILHFFRDDIGGILITDEKGAVLYEDQKTAFIRKEKTNWKVACPPPRLDQKGEMWDLLHSDSGKTFMVTTSTFEENGEMIQVHHLMDTSLYMSLYRDMSDYSRALKHQKEHDGMTGLFNKGKFMEMKNTLFAKQETIAVFNMDLNFLKQTNDTYGHEAGDRLIRKAAESLKKIEARNVMPFRVGGDEFMVVAIHISRGEAEQLQKRWEAGLEELNQADDGLPCVIACGFAYGDKGFDLEEVFAQADQRMYEDKKAKKQKAGQPVAPDPR